MKNAGDFARDATRIYDLTKEYHALDNELKDRERELLLGLPQDDQLLDRDKEPLLGAWLENEIEKSHGEQMARIREVLAEIEAMKNEQSATVAAGWAADIALKERIAS